MKQRDYRNGEKEKKIESEKIGNRVREKAITNKQKRPGQRILRTAMMKCGK